MISILLLMLIEMLGSSCPTSGGLPLRAEAISASRDQWDTTDESVSLDKSIPPSRPGQQRRRKPQLQPMWSGRKQPAVGHQTAKRQKVDKHVRFAEDKSATKITEFFVGDIVEPEQHHSTVEEHQSPLLKLFGMPDFVHRATTANVTKCCARSSFMPCCRVMPKKGDVMSLLPGKWLTDNVSHFL